MESKNITFTLKVSAPGYVLKMSLYEPEYAILV